MYVRINRNLYCRRGRFVLIQNDRARYGLELTFETVFMIMVMVMVMVMAVIVMVMLGRSETSVILRHHTFSVPIMSL